MRWVSRMKVCVVVTMLAIASSVITARVSAQANAVRFERFALKNDVRVVHAHVPDAERQATFVFLPLGLAHDGANQAQWSHLLEHMLIRSTDPQPVHDPELGINGETMAGTMRLEAISVPARFAESAAKIADWLGASEVHEETLEREKQMIAQEERSVSINAMTHKFAVAGWAQIVQHGIDHAQVNGDVQQAAAAEVAEAIRRLIPIDGRVLIATIGPAARDEVQRVLEDTIGAVEPRKVDRVQRSAPSMAAHHATWDLPHRHVFVWWRLPNATIERRAALFVLHRVMSMRLMRHGQILADVRNPLLELIDGGDDGLVLLSDVNIPEGQEPDRGRVTPRFTFETLLEDNGMYGHPAQWAARLAGELTLEVDFAQFRAQMPAHMRGYLEANWFLQRVMREYEWNAPIEEIIAAIAAVKRETLDAVHREMLEGGSGDLTMTPSLKDPAGLN